MRKHPADSVFQEKVIVPGGMQYAEEEFDEFIICNLLSNLINNINIYYYQTVYKYVNKA